MLSLIFSLYLSATLMMCFLHIRVGVAMFIVYSILVPFLQVFSFGQNLFYALVLVALLLRYSYRSFYYKPLKPFILLFLIYLIATPFHNEVPYSFQLNLLRSDFMGAIILPFVMINIMKNDPKAISTFNIAILFSITVAGLYSLFLTTMPGFNPHLLVTLPLSGSEFNEAYAFAEDGGRIFGRISGVFEHPMTNGLFLSLSLFYVFFQLHLLSSKKNKHTLVLHFGIISIILIALLVVGVRTAIVAVGIGFLTFMLLEKNIKSLFTGLIIVALIYFSIQTKSDLGLYLSSIADKDSASVQGSSFEMRLDQLNGAIQSISGNFLFGNGYGWTTYYMTTRGAHPTLLYFESLLFAVLCNNGLFGLISWSAMIFIYYYSTRRSLTKRSFNFTTALMAVYLTYSMVTGEYNYLKYFLIFYVIVWMQGQRLKLTMKKLNITSSYSSSKLQFT